MAINYNLLGVIDTNDKEAIKYYELSLKSALESNNRRMVAYAYSNIGIRYTNLSQYKKALTNQFKALIIENEMNDLYGVATEYVSISQAYRGLYNQSINKSNFALIDSGIYYLNLGIALCIKYDFPVERIEMIQELSKCYEQKLEFSKAYTSLNEAMVLKDTSFINQNRKQILDIETEQKIKLKEKEIQIQNLQLVKNKHQKNALSVGILLTILAMAFIFLQL